MTQCTIAKKRVSVYPSAAPNKPVLYLHTYADEGDAAYRAMQQAGCPDFTLIAISGLDWNRDMAPWDIPPVTGQGMPCTGGADAYLRCLLQEILPEAERAVGAGCRGEGSPAIHWAACSHSMRSAAAIALHVRPVCRDRSGSRIFRPISRHTVCKIIRRTYIFRWEARRARHGTDICAPSGRTPRRLRRFIAAKAWIRHWRSTPAATIKTCPPALRRAWLGFCSDEAMRREDNENDRARYYSQKCAHKVKPAGR